MNFKRWLARTISNLFCLAVLILSRTHSIASEPPQLLAFPGAEGFGRFATGGRGGTVYHVTNLDDNGPGSFRDAVSRPQRIVVFDVGGVIRIKTRISVASHLTIAGQTAPGDGIAVYGNGVSFSDANQTITRYVRFRMGIHGDSGKDAVTIARGNNLIFDHVSVSWGRDENFSISGPVTNVTIQDSIIAQGLQPHSAGGLIQTPGGVSILRSLYVDNHTRNPKVKGVNQYVNNVVYNWGGGGGYILGDSESESFAAIVNNYFIDGPSTSVSAFSRANANFHLYASGNFQDSNRNGKLDGKLVVDTAYGPVSWQKTPFDHPPITVLSPAQALLAVGTRAGDSMSRDATDRQLIRELESLGTAGETIRNETNAPMEGIGAIQGGAVPTDTDQDGMPDFWELANGLNPADSEDRNRTGDGGYTRLEEYLDWLASPHLAAIEGKVAEIDLRSLVGGFGSANYRIIEPRNCSVALSEDGRTARFTPAKGFSGRAGFQVVLSDAAQITNAVDVLVQAAKTAR